MQHHHHHYHHHCIHLHSFLLVLSFVSLSFSFLLFIHLLNPFITGTHSHIYSTYHLLILYTFINSCEGIAIVQTLAINLLISTDPSKCQQNRLISALNGLNIEKGRSRSVPWWSFRRWSVGLSWGSLREECVFVPHQRRLESHVKPLKATQSHSEPR